MGRLEAFLQLGIPLRVSLRREIRKRRLRLFGAVIASLPVPHDPGALLADCLSRAGSKDEEQSEDVDDAFHPGFLCRSACTRIGWRIGDCVRGQTAAPLLSPARSGRKVHAEDLGTRELVECAKGAV